MRLTNQAIYSSICWMLTASTQALDTLRASYVRLRRCLSPVIGAAVPPQFIGGRGEPLVIGAIPLKLQIENGTSKICNNRKWRQQNKTEAVKTGDGERVDDQDSRKSNGVEPLSRLTKLAASLLQYLLICCSLHQPHQPLLKEHLHPVKVNRQTHHCTSSTTRRACTSRTQSNCRERNAPA